MTSSSDLNLLPEKGGGTAQPFKDTDDIKVLRRHPNGEPTLIAVSAVVLAFAKLVSGARGVGGTYEIEDAPGFWVVDLSHEQPGTWTAMQRVHQVPVTRWVWKTYGET